MGCGSELLDAHNVRVIGNGSQVLVLGHGFGSDQSAWQFVVPYFANDHKVVLYDLMGAGRTNQNNFNFARYATLHAHADDLLMILDEMQIESCIFVGHSMSGMIGCIASIERPQVFRKIILLSSSPRYINDEHYNGGFEQEELNQLFEAMQSNFRAWVIGFAPRAVGADLKSTAVKEFTRTFFGIRPDIALSICRTCFQSDVRSILPQVTVPCYVLQSCKDLAVPVVVSDYLFRSLGGPTKVEILQTEGHLPQLSCPELLIPVMKRAIMD
ncbi:unnamed protein product [Sphagnum troendelagicum]|uniref:AB hydrolase-1 domain-containing protein n=1 Tax=Sphagnum troendelagicum TaxID=128251 RepID=A0ABP0T7N3_9BRYO